MSLLAKFSMISPAILPSLPYLPWPALGGVTVDKIISICVASPKVAKASKEGKAISPALLC